MPGSFRFRGFTAGSIVALTLGQGAASAQASLTWGQTGGGGQPNATFSIQLVDGCTDVVAPYGAVFRATGFSGFKTPEGGDLFEPPGDTNVYDETQHHIFYFWKFGDADYVRLIAPNIPTAWRNLDLGYGREVAHVWQNPGDRTVECFAVDMLGNWGVATYRFGAGGQSPTIADPNTVFAGANTIVWSQLGDFTGAPLGATQCTTIAQVHDALRARMNGNNRSLRVLMRAGETFDNNWFFTIGDGVGTPSGYPGGTAFNYRDNMKGCHFGRFGAGANPKITYTQFTTSQNFSTPDRVDCRQFVVSNLDFSAAYDSETETGFGGPGGTTRQGFIISNRCQFTKDAQSITNSWRWAISYDCRIAGWDNYGVFNQSSGGQAMIGCEIAQSALTLNGLEVPFGNPTEWDIPGKHGAMRTFAIYEFILSGCYLRSVSGWSNSDGNGITAPPSGGQPALRHMNYFAGDPNDRRHYHIIERCALENSCSLGPHQWPGYRVETACKNLVFDTNLCIGTAAIGGGGNAATPGGDVGYLLNTPLSGVTIRNSYFWRPGVPKLIPTAAYSAEIQVQFLSNGTLAGVGPVEIYNNTIFIETPLNGLTSTYNPITLGAGAPPGYYKVQNNIVRAVNYASPVDYRGTAFLPLSTAPIDGFVPRYPGPRWRFNYIFVANVETVRESPSSPGTIVAGPVAPGEWVRIAWPNIAGQNNGAAPSSAAAYRAAVIGNSTQKHFVSIHNQLLRLTDTEIFPGSKGGVTFDLTGSTHFRVRNDTANTWTNRGILVLFDMADILMAPMAVHASPSSLPSLVPQAGSSAIIASRPALWPWGDFFLQPRRGSMDRGTIITSGSHASGALAAA